MPSNFTENYQLSQWEPGDQVLREDFNADNAKIDAVLGAASQRLATRGNCEIITGSYVGTGTAGKDNPTVLTFPKKPLLVFIYSGSSPTIATYGAYCTLLSTVGYNKQVFSIWTENTLSLYDNSSSPYPNNQSNAKGWTYHYIAFMEA